MQQEIIVPKSRQNSSSTGRGKGAQIDQTKWRQQLQASRIKFDDQQKDIYLKELQISGLKCHSALCAGVAYNTVIKHRKNDPDFEELEQYAHEHYKAVLAQEIDRRGREGWEEPVFHKGVRAMEPILLPDGTIKLNKNKEPMMRYASIRKFDASLLILQAKRHEPEYRDRQQIDLNAKGGGVLVCPPDTPYADFIAKLKAREDKPKPGSEPPSE